MTLSQNIVKIDQYIETTQPNLTDRILIDEGDGNYKSVQIGNMPLTTKQNATLCKTYSLTSDMVYGIDFTDESIPPVFNCVLTSVGDLAFFSFFIAGASNSTEFGIDLPVVSFQNYAISPKLQCSDNDGFYDDGVASLVDFDPVRVKFGRGFWGTTDWLPTMYKMISGSIIFPIIR